MGVRSTIVLAVCAGISGCGAAEERPAVSTSPGEGGAVPWVDVFVGTGDADVGSAVINGKSGATFPGASLPFGMVQLSPDTPGAAPPGYAHGDDRIVGFSFTHLSGAGCPAMRDFPVFPLIGEVDPANEPSAGFSHRDEIASPGFYEVMLDSGIKVDLTATKRAGLVRFTFPESEDAKVLLAGGFVRDQIQVLDFSAEIRGSDLVVGQRDNGQFCLQDTRYTVFFAARFERPFDAHGVWQDGQRRDGDGAVSGTESGLYFSFDAEDDRVVQLKMGLSYVSVENALANLDAEIPGWNFDEVHARAIDTWNDRLGRIAVDGGTDDERRSFYTALYHVLLQPSVTSDVNGDFMEFDGTVGHAGDHPRYSQISGWDTYRSWIQLAALVAPVETTDIVRSLIAAGQQCGAMPKWPIANQESSTMIGDPAPLIVANAWAFGARDFDIDQALALARHAAEDPEASCSGKAARDDLALYLERGYCPIDDGVAWGPVSTTLEYAIADFAVAQLATAAGDDATAAALLARARSWQNVFDPTREANGFVGYVQPRLRDDDNGAPRFEEAAIDDEGDGFVEGNPAQYTWMVPHDVPGLAALLGGDALMVERLDAFFEEVNAGTDRPYGYIGNEPGFGAPWLYPFVGAPSRTHALVRRMLREAFSLTPGGLPGNDDLGATSSWQVWAMLGVYPAIPAVGGLVVGSPVFRSATITLASGDAITIITEGEPPHVQGLRVDGQESTSSWLSWDQLERGATLELTLSATPSETWGMGPSDRPPASYP